MDKCIFSDETTNCKGKCKYGGYCYKHRRNHLIDENNLVNVHLFTGLSKDYLKSDLLYFSKHVLQKNHLKVEKQTLINDIQEFINRYRDYETKIDSIAVACIDAESDSAIFPCGLSRQRLSEFNTDYVIVVQKDTFKKYTFDEILPFDFKF